MKIKLNNITLFGYHGIYDKEAKEGQNFVISASIKLKKKYINSDSIDDTVDYVKVIQTIESVFEKKRYKLIDSLATDIINEILLDSRIKSIVLSIKKTDPPIDVDIDSVEVVLKGSNG